MGGIRDGDGDCAREAATIAKMQNAMHTCRGDIESDQVRPPGAGVKCDGNPIDRRSSAFVETTARQVDRRYKRTTEARKLFCETNDYAVN